MFSPLQKKLLPTISSISASEIWLALFPLQRSFVTDHVVQHPRFENRILEYVMADYDVDLSGPVIPFDKEHILQAILSIPKRTIFQSLGLSWNAELVACNALHASKDGPSPLTDFSRDEIRFALKFRSETKNSARKLPDVDGITKDGLLCFATWIADIPEDVRQLLAYACEAKSLSIPDIHEMPQAEVDARNDLCTRWCEQRMALQAADQTEDVQEPEAEPT